MEDTIEQITRLPAPITLVLSLWILGLALRLAKMPPNKFIPLILCVGGALIYPLISSDERVGFSYAGIKPLFYLQGFLYGAGAVAANEILRNIPIIGSFLDKMQNAFKKGVNNGSNDTTITTKNSVTNKIENENKSNPNPSQ